MNTFDFKFEELPLVLAPGIEAALINGKAEIEYSRDGHWQINSISVEGYRQITQAERAASVKPWVYIPASATLEAIIVGRLNKEWRSKIVDAVREQIADDREAA